MADHTQGYPGHVDPPGSLVTYAGLFAIVSIGCFLLGQFYFRAAMFLLGLAFIAGALMSLMFVPRARRFCEQHGGGVCPSCGHKNQVRWNS
jgi:hypothetical protein